MGSYMSDAAAAILYCTTEEKLVQQKVILFQRSGGLKISSESKIAKTHGFMRTLNLMLFNVSQIRSNYVIHPRELFRWNRIQLGAIQSLNFHYCNQSESEGSQEVTSPSM